MADTDDPFADKGGDSQVGTAFDWLTGFGKSALESVPELVGITPSESTMKWRQDNPVAGFASEMIGVPVPYAGWLKAVQLGTKVSKGVARFDKAVNAIGDMNKSPFLTGALQTTAKFAPFEGLRVAASQAVGDKDFSSMLGDATFSLAAGAGIGGVLHGLSAAGLRDPSLKTLFPGIDLASPLPLQARQMRDIINSGKITDPEQLARANYKLKDTLNLARMDELKGGEQYVAPLDHNINSNANHKGLQEMLNRVVFKPGMDVENRTVQVRRFGKFGKEGRDFPTDTEWKDAMTRSALTEGFSEHGQYFRHVSFNEEPARIKSSTDMSKHVDNVLTKNMEKVDTNTFMTKEADDGMFVLARKIEGTPGKPSPSDEWTVWKTDKPGTFVPDGDKWAKMQVDALAWNPTAKVSPNAGLMYNAVANNMQTFSLRNYMSLDFAKQGIGKVVDALIPEAIKGNAAFNAAGGYLKEILAPRIYQFRKSPRANWIMNNTKVGFDRGEDLVNAIMNGTVRVDPGRQLVWNSLKSNGESPLPGVGAVRELVDAVPPEKWGDFYKIWRQGLMGKDLEDAMLKGDINVEAGTLAKNLQKLDGFTMQSLHKTEDAVGQKLTKWLANRFGMQRVWEGDNRIVIRDESGAAVGQAGGPNRRAAQKAANDIIAERAEMRKKIGEDVDWKIEEEFRLSEPKSIPEGLETSPMSPNYMKNSANLRGFKYDTEPFTKEEFLKGFEDNLRDRVRHESKISVDDLMSPQVSRLQGEDASAARQVEARFNAYAGIQTDWGKLQNRMVDKVLGTMMGPNSATKIAQYTNTALFNLQLGALKFSYPVVNALNFIQTVMPEVAFVMGKAPADRLAPDYVHFAAGGTKGPVGGVGVLSPIKLMLRSAKEMMSPSAETAERLTRAANERIIDPRVTEEYVGKSATKIQDLRKAASSGKDFAEWLRSISEFMPAQTERLSRTHTFIVGDMMARDYLRSRTGGMLNPEQIYQFAKQFTERTMYLYTAADKPRVFNTPAGSMMGLFKNWMFHYMASMAQYAGEGVNHNNWAPLLWQTTGTAALGGATAIPGAFLAEKFAGMWSNKSLTNMAYDNMNSKVADGIVFGLPAALTGVSLYSQVNNYLSNPTRDASQIFSSAAWDRAKQVGKFAGAAFDHWQATGEHPAWNQDVRDMMMRTFAPTSIYRTMAAFEDPDKVIQLGTQRPLMKNASTMDKIFYSAGFSPTEIDRGQAIANELYQKHEKMKAQVKQLGDAWADAEVNHDAAGMTRIMRQGMVWGVDVGQVIREGMKNLKKLHQGIIERQLKPAERAQYLRLLQLEQGEEQ